MQLVASSTAGATTGICIGLLRVPHRRCHAPRGEVEAVGDLERHKPVGRKYRLKCSVSGISVELQSLSPLQMRCYLSTKRIIILLPQHFSDRDLFG